MRWNWRAALGVATISLQAIAGRTGSAQSRPTPSRGTEWIVAGDPSTDLWFHSLATIGLTGPGSLPFYDARYARLAAAEKARRGIPPSALDRNGARLASAITGDSAFEVLHFLPLYLRATSPAEFAHQVRAIARDDDVTGIPAEIRRAVRSALPSTSERTLLLELADAIDDESRTFFTAYAADRASDDSIRRRDLQARWDDSFAPRLAAVFRMIGVRRGVLLISPPLGPEGRVVNLASAGMIIAVSDWRGATPDAPLLASIREMCFPFLEQVWKIDRSTHAARGAEESSQAAVRCGAEVVDSLTPASAAAYRALFLGARPGETPAEYRRRFDQRFSIDAATLRAISRELRRVVARPLEPS